MSSMKDKLLGQNRRNIFLWSKFENGFLWITNGLLFCLFFQLNPFNCKQSQTALASSSSSVSTSFVLPVFQFFFTLIFMTRSCTDPILQPDVRIWLCLIKGYLIFFVFFPEYQVQRRKPPVFLQRFPAARRVQVVGQRGVLCLTGSFLLRGGRADPQEKAATGVYRWHGFLWAAGRLRRLIRPRRRLSEASRWMFPLFSSLSTRGSFVLGSLWVGWNHRPTEGTRKHNYTHSAWYWQRLTKITL